MTKFLSMEVTICLVHWPIIVCTGLPDHKYLALHTTPLQTYLASKQANIHTHVCNAVLLVCGSLRLTPITILLNVRTNQQNSDYFKGSTL